MSEPNLGRGAGVLGLGVAAAMVVAARVWGERRRESDVIRLMGAKGRSSLGTKGSTA